MSEDQGRDQLLVLTGKTGHIAVRHKVGAVLVVARPIDRQPKLVQPGGPAEQPPRFDRFQRPLLRSAIQEEQGRALHARRLLDVDSSP